MGSLRYRTVLSQRPQTVPLRGGVKEHNYPGRKRTVAFETQLFHIYKNIILTIIFHFCDLELSNVFNSASIRFRLDH